ncbi:MAG: GNAT family N-acetyltransferase [Alphaproteobacteria bacterium]
MADFTIVPLFERPEYRDEVAQHLWRQWGKNDGQTLAQRLEFINRNSQDPSLSPDWQNFIALDGDGQAGAKWLGTASFVQQDPPCPAPYAPFLGSVYTPEQARHRGIGRALVARVEAFARSQAVKTLHLWTPDKAHFYAKMGWQEIDSFEKDGETETIMCKDL